MAFSTTLFLSLAIVSALPRSQARRQRCFAQASMDGNLRRMQVLYFAGAKINSRGSCCLPLFLAVGSGKAEAVRYLLDQGADVNAREQFGQTPLTEAAFHGNIAVIKELLLRGADVNAIADEGTALDVAIKTNNAAVTDLLKHHGGKRACEIRASC